MIHTRCSLCSCHYQYFCNSLALNILPSSPCIYPALTEPEVVRNLSVTEITTSSISVMWNKPEGNSSSYRVQWSDGDVTKSENVNQTQINITDLTAGVQYDIHVTAVAGDGSTEGQSATVFQYTSK